MIEIFNITKTAYKDKEPHLTDSLSHKRFNEVQDKDPSRRILQMPVIVVVWWCI